jgi:hypothetical protein
MTTRLEGEMSEPGSTLPEKLGASAGVWAAFWIGLHYFMLRGAAANPAMADADYVRLLLDERMRWEWATALRVMGGIMIVWFMGSLAGRLRLAEGEPGRLSSITLGIGALWGAVWLLSATFNSAAIVLGTQYQNVAGARLAGTLGWEIPLILTPAISFALFLAVAFAALRHGGYSRAFATATAGVAALLLVLAIVEWYGPGNIGLLIVALALGWMAVTSALTIGPYRSRPLAPGVR